jgi:hypothetical protein
MPVSKPSIPEPEPPPRAGSTVPEFARRIRVSARTAGRIIARREVESFLIGGRRLIDDDSADAYIARCKAAGPQFEPPPSPGQRRRPGRPKRNPKPEAATASAG